MRNPLAHIPTGRAAAAMANGLPVVYPNTLSTTPRGGDSRPSLFLRLIAWLLIVTISTSMRFASLAAAWLRMVAISPSRTSGMSESKNTVAAKSKLIVTASAKS